MEKKTINLKKGYVDVYDFGDIKLHSYQTNDLMNDESYNDLAIHQGMEAVFEWRHLDHNEQEDREEIIENLKKYCSMDTYAMLVVYNWLKKLITE